MSTPTERSTEPAVPQAVPAFARAAVPSGWSARATVWEYLVLTWRPYFVSGLASAVIAPLLYLLALGYGMGSLIEARGTAALGGVRYVEFIGPALLCAAALQIGFGEASWALFGRFKWHRTLWGITSTPITPAQAAEGHVLFLVTRVAVSSVLYYLVLLVFGAAGGPAGVLMLPVAVLTALACGVWVMALSATISDDGPGAFNLVMRFGIIPMTLFSASFFPITQLPWSVRWVAFLSPLWHGNELARGAAIGGLPFLQAVGHLAFLLALAVTGFLVMRKRFDVRLVV